MSSLSQPSLEPCRGKGNHWDTAVTHMSKQTCRKQPDDGGPTPKPTDAMTRLNADMQKFVNHQGRSATKADVSG